MARLLLQAVGAEPYTSPAGQDTLEIAVSVSRTDGTPVTGLGTPNFRVADVLEGPSVDHTVDRVREAKWEPGDQTEAGCYRIWLKKKPAASYAPGRYVFGVQARTLRPGIPPQEVDRGQTLLVVTGSTQNVPK